MADLNVTRVVESNMMDTTLLVARDKVKAEALPSSPLEIQQVADSDNSQTHAKDIRGTTGVRSK